MMQHVLLMQRTGECIAESLNKFVSKVITEDVVHPMPTPDATVRKKNSKTTGTGFGTGQSPRRNHDDADPKATRTGPASRNRVSQDLPKGALLALTAALVSCGVISNDSDGWDSLHQLDIGVRDLLTGRWMERPKVSSLM